MTDFALEIKNLTKEYPGVKALDHVSLKIKRGEVHAVVGENGAGKSTLIKCIAGAIKPNEGSIVINGREYDHLLPQLAKSQGIEVIYQEFNLVPQMSCTDNLFLNYRPEGSYLVNHKERRKAAKECFDSLGVDIDPDRKVASYSPAYQQIIEICKAVSRNVKILIMDEPTAPLTVAEIDLLFGIVRNLKERGVTIIYISHRLEEIFTICDSVSVMRDGQYIVTLDTKETSRQELINLMVGRELKESYPSRNNQIGEDVLKVENLTGNGVKDINFTLHKGEILGFAGLVGAGRTEIMNVIYGANKLDSGQIFLDGSPVAIKSPEEAIRHGIGLIPEDRKALGAFLGYSIKWNTSISVLKQISNVIGVLDRKKENEIAEKYRKAMHIKTPSLDQLVGNLSGGNQQKVVLAKTMATNAHIIIFDEPTRGIDVGAKQEIYALMNSLVEAGNSILMISSDMPELLGMSDNLVIICEGRQAGMLSKAEFSSEKVLNLASGNR